jgi:hypothetical protein
MNDLMTEIVDINEDALDALFNETPEKTVNADNLVGAKQIADDDFEDVDADDEDEPKVPAKKTAKAKKEKTTPAKSAPIERTDTIEDVDLDEVPEGDDDEEADDAEEEDTKKASKEEKAKAKADAAAEKAKEEGTEGGEEVISVLKSTVDYLVEQGIWQDFEGREDMEFNEETYAKLVAEQDKLRVQGMFEELVDSTGTFGKAIINFVKNGGNPDEIIDLFKEQKSVESISIESVDGQKSIIKQYYTDVMGWKPEKAEKYISNLVLSNELESEATEVKDLYKTYYDKEAKRLNKEQDESIKKQQEAEQAFTSNIQKEIKDRKDLTPSEKKVVEDYLLAYDQKLPNGNLVNKFYVNFAKMQANPTDYVDLVLFVMDKQKFVQKVATKEKTEAAAKAFSFIKGNGAVSKNKGTTHQSIKQKEKTTSFDWGLPK